MAKRLNWETDGRIWPHREASRFVEARGLRSHVQVMGQGPALLLLHGTGAASHSWRGLAPLLAPHYTIVAPDLPGHGFSEMPASGRLSLPGMAQSARDLLDVLQLQPEFAVGHSAGAAIALEMCLKKLIRPRAIVSLNGALVPYGGRVAEFFSPFARLLAANPLAQKFFAWQASAPGAVDRLLDNTGSRISAEGAQIYQMLVRDPAHVAGALAMMAGWDLAALMRELPRLDVPLLLVAGGRDRMIPPDQAHAIRALAPGARVIQLRRHGHLAHEQEPGEIAGIIRSFFQEIAEPAECAVA